MFRSWGFLTIVRTRHATPVPVVKLTPKPQREVTRFTFNRMTGEPFNDLSMWQHIDKKNDHLAMYRKYVKHKYGV